MYSLPTYPLVSITDQTVVVSSHGRGLLEVFPDPLQERPYNRIERFRGDSVLRHLNLTMGGGLKSGLSTPFFENFRRVGVVPAYFTSPPTVYGAPAQPNVPLSQTVFNAMFRHFLYDLGDDLKLPGGAFFAGSSCVAALCLPPWANQLLLHSLETRARTNPAGQLLIGRLQ